MSFLPNPIACDVCKAIKQPSNHWFYVVKDGSISEARKWDSPPWFQVRAWDEFAEDRNNGDKIEHICGQSCAVKKLAEWMNAQSTGPKPETAAVDSASPTS